MTRRSTCLLGVKMTTKRTCSFCGCNETKENILMEEGYYEDVFICNDCWPSEKVKSWRDKKGMEDEGYRCYMESITAGFKISCRSCGAATLRYPKFIGHSPCWELCCDKCEKVDYNGISPYEYDLDEWHKVYDKYQKGIYDLKSNWRQLEEMEKNLNLPLKKCDCGGAFTILAQPRCVKCKNIVDESIFHVCDDSCA